MRERFCAAKDRKNCPGVDEDGIQTEMKRCVSDECNGKITEKLFFEFLEENQYRFYLQDSFLATYILEERKGIKKYVFFAKTYRILLTTSSVVTSYSKRLVNKMEGKLETTVCQKNLH